MKSKVFVRAISSLLCVLMLVPAFASCNKNEEAEDTTETTAPATTTDSGASDEFDINAIINSSDYVMVVTEGNSDYVIVYPAGGELEKAAAESLKEKIEVDTGAIVELRDDTSPETEKEILIGQTNRKADDGILSGIKVNDYIVKASGKKILVGAYNVEGFEMAWKRVMIALNVTEANGQMYAYFKSDYSYQRNGDYTADDLTVNGISISKYTVVYGDDLEKSIAEHVQLMIQSACGYVLPIKKSANASEAGEFEILVGSNTGRAAANLTTDNTYEFKTADKALVLYYTNNRSGKQIADELEAAIEALIKDGKSELKDIAISGTVAAAGTGAIIASMNFDGITAGDTEAVLNATGINVLYENAWSFPDKKLAVITTDGKLALNGGGTAYELFSSAKLSGVKNFTLQFDLSVTSLGVMEILLAKENSAYSSVVANSVMFRNFSTSSASSGWTNGTSNLGYLTQHLSGSTKTPIGPQQTNIGDSAAFGKTYKVVIEVETGASISVSIFDGSNQVGATRTVKATDGTLVDTISSISIRLENAPVILDNIILSDGNYVDFLSAN